ncbi:hypothetical protein PUN28_008504 [Cardiocondyla obscurior]|uniref:Uncharacterized protein n=1 Tax=Cardiocondyla obscurior TaxID=286306 RepID=A0AAW2G0D6_9HYME
MNRLIATCTSTRLSAQLRKNVGYAVSTRLRNGHRRGICVCPASPWGLDEPRCPSQYTANVYPSTFNHANTGCDLNYGSWTMYRLTAT